VNSDIGYSPAQPVEFSHKVHSSDYELKCLFCHHEAEENSFSAIPTTFSCMVCHVALKPESEKMIPVIESYDNNKPIIWNRLYKLPEYTKFNHNAHIMSGIDCASCHGEVEKMDNTYKVRDMTMNWCLDCHRDPERYIIKSRDITGLFIYNEKNWNISDQQRSTTVPYSGSYFSTQNFTKYAITATKKEAGRGPENCSACHY